MAANNNNSKANPRSQSIKKSIMKRVSSLYVIFALLAFAVFAMILITQFGPNGTPLRNRSDYRCYRTMPVHASRGNIYAHDGRILATNSPNYDISLDFTVLNNMEDREFYSLSQALADSLSRTIPQYSKAHFQKRLKDIRNIALKGGRGSQNQRLIRERVDQLQLDRMKTFPIFKEGRLRGGFIYSQSSDRYKPFDDMAARTIGRPEVSAGDMVVTSGYGLEQSFNNTLAGKNGRNKVVRLYSDKWVPVSDKENVKAKNGKDIITTIDINIQDIVDNELGKQILKQNAMCGTAVVMDVESGEIRAVSNLTRYHNTVKDDNNYAITMRAEPGSTFKLVSLLALLEEANYDINMAVDCTDNGKYYYSTPRGKKYLIEDSHPVGKTTLMGVMEHSSNIGFVKLFEKEYDKEPQRFVDFVNGLGINKAFNMQLLGGHKPIIKDPKSSWDGLTLIKMSYGYAIEFTPIHTLMVYNAVANNGKMVAPRLVSAITEDGRVVEKFEKEVINEKIASEKNISIARQSLEGVVLRGTGSALSKKTYSAAGKTGTAQMVIPGKGYMDDKGNRHYLATFVGYFPADNPKYSCIVAIKTSHGPSGRNTYYGASLALPAFEAILDRIYTLDEEWATPIDTQTTKDAVPVKGGYVEEVYRAANNLSVETDLSRGDRGWGITATDSLKVSVQQVDIKSDTIPSVIGMGLKDAIYLLEQCGLSVNFSGKGRVVSQSIKAGTAANETKAITLKLAPSEKKSVSQTRR